MSVASRAVAADERVGEHEHAPLGGVRGALLDQLARSRRPAWTPHRPSSFQRQLLELAQEPLLALPHLGDERLRGRLVERET